MHRKLRETPSERIYREVMGRGRDMPRPIKLILLRKPKAKTKKG
jgi:hypothetical protein